MATTLDDIIHAVHALRRDFAATDQHVSEVRDRTRRTETRLTRYLESIGFGTKATKPWYDATMRAVQVPSPDCSLKDVMDAIPPEDDPSRVAVRVGNDVIAYITRAP